MAFKSAEQSLNLCIFGASDMFRLALARATVRTRADRPNMVLQFQPFFVVLCVADEKSKCINHVESVLVLNCLCRKCIGFRLYPKKICLSAPQLRHNGGRRRFIFISHSFVLPKATACDKEQTLCILIPENEHGRTICGFATTIFRRGCESTGCIS